MPPPPLCQITISCFYLFVLLFIFICSPLLVYLSDYHPRSKCECLVHPSMSDNHLLFFIYFFSCFYLFFLLCWFICQTTTPPCRVKLSRHLVDQMLADSKPGRGRRGTTKLTPTNMWDVTQPVNYAIDTTEISEI